ncbi:MAG: hypothetical protein U0M06_06360 [Clostridia bacterium]|jgi:hypothetical protein|nr:hypothetical protein [Clostridia bacterium]
MGAKGQPKTGGRQKGSLNKVGGGLRDKIRAFAEDNFDKVIEAWEAIDDPKDKLKAYTDLCTYALPKLQAVQLDANINKVSDVEEDLKALSEEDK